MQEKNIKEREIIERVKKNLNNNINVLSRENLSLKKGYFHFPGTGISFPDILYWDGSNSFLVEIKNPKSKEFNADLKEFSKAAKEDGLIDIDKLILKISTCCPTYPSFSYPKRNRLGCFFIQKYPIHRMEDKLLMKDFREFVEKYTYCFFNSFKNCLKGYFCSVIPNIKSTPLILKITKTKDGTISYFNLAGDGLSEAITYALRLKILEVWYTNTLKLYIFKNLEESKFSTLELQNINGYKLAILCLAKPTNTTPINLGKIKNDTPRNKLYEAFNEIIPNESMETKIFLF
jgi:hypothetical protein